MNIFELEKLTDATIDIALSDELLSSFYNEYLEQADYEPLKKERPEIIAAKITAISEFVYRARLALDMIQNPDSSPLVAAYQRNAAQSEAYIRERGGEENDRGGKENF